MSSLKRKIPYLKTQGTAYEVGACIGEEFRLVIQAVIDKNRATPDYQLLLDGIRLEMIASKKLFPEIFTELEGLSQGANVNLSDMFFNNSSMVNLCGQDHCTSLVSFSDNGAIVGHNEDQNADSLPELFLLEATVSNVSFLSLTYASQLPGCSVTINNFGLVQCIDELHQHHNLNNGVSKYFLARAVLNCENIDQAKQLIRKTPVTCGFNHLLVQGNNLVNIEVTYKNKSTRNIYQKPFAHTNHHLHRQTQELETNKSKSSQHRLEVANQHNLNGLTVRQVSEILKNQQDKKFPICQENMTIGSAIVEAAKLKMWVCKGNPRMGKYYPFNLNG